MSQPPRIAPTIPYTTAGRGAPPDPRGSVVHESEVQRQHARVRMPGIVEVGDGKERQRFRLHDLSAGGFSFDAPPGSFRAGTAGKGSLIINLDQIALTFAVPFQVRSVNGKGRVGCGFQSLGQREISGLRHLITSSLSGDVVNVGEVLHTMARDNFTRARPAKEEPRGAAAGGGLRAAVASLLVLAGGVTALAYAAQKLHEALFVSVATAAKVAGPVYTVAMPREGTFYSLVPPDGMVKKGAPIASFEAPVLDLVRSQALNANLSAEQVDKMLRQTVKGTITSPCDCRVQNQLVAEAQFVTRGQVLFELIPRQFDSFVVASFRHDQIDELSPGRAVHFRISGDDATHTGRISQLRVPGTPGMEFQLGDGLIALIEPDQPVPNDLVNRPAEVSVGGLQGLADLFEPAERAVANEGQ
jgi:alginate biosynthesis protein Alg44